MARRSRSRAPKADLTEELIASMKEVMRIMAGELPPSQIRRAANLAAKAVARAGGHRTPGK